MLSGLDSNLDIVVPYFFLKWIDPGKIFPIVWLILPVFFITMSREIAKDIEDIRGDRLISIQSHG
jgi:4-hydroxybenzoate polyprenyltransferase